MSSNLLNSYPTYVYTAPSANGLSEAQIEADVVPIVINHLTTDGQPANFSTVNASTISLAGVDLSTTISGIQSTASSQASTISSLSTSVSNFPSTYTAQTSSNQISNSVSTLNSSLSSLSTTLSGISSSLSNYAPLNSTSSAISCGSLSIPSLSFGTNDLKTSLSNINTSINNLSTSTSNAVSSVQTLNSPQNVSGSVLNSISNAATNYYSATAGAGLSSSLSSLSTTVAGHTTTLNTLTGTSSSSISGQIQASLSSTNQSISVASLSAPSITLNGTSLTTTLATFDTTTARQTAINSAVSPIQTSITTLNGNATTSGSVLSTIGSYLSAGTNSFSVGSATIGSLSTSGITSLGSINAGTNNIIGGSATLSALTSTTASHVNLTTSGTTSLAGLVSTGSINAGTNSITVGSLTASSGTIGGSNIITQTSLTSQLSSYDPTASVNQAIAASVGTSTSSLLTGSATTGALYSTSVSSTGNVIGNNATFSNLNTGSHTASQLFTTSSSTLAGLTSTSAIFAGTNALTAGSGVFYSTPTPPGYPTLSCGIVSSIPTVQAYSNGSTLTELMLSGSSVHTPNNTLDDGTGAMTVNGVFRAVNSGNNQFGSVQSTSTTTTVYGSGGLTVDYNFNVVGNSCQLGNSGSTTSVYTAHNTLDDGSGDIIASRAVAATGDFPAFPALTVPYVRMGVGSNAIPFVQSVNGAGTNMQLALNPGGGKVTTYTNTLDDGSGNLTAKGSLQVNQNGTSTLGLSIQCSPSAAYGFSDAVIGDAVYQAQGNTNALFGFVGSGAGLGSQASLLRLNYTNSSVKTKNNTLDDGSGNMTLAFPASSSTLNGGAARVQIGATADFNSNTYGLGVAGPATGAYPFGVMVGTGSASVVALQVSKFFGVTTKSNTLDDGNGNMLVSSSSSLSYTPSTPPLYVKTSGTGGGVIAQFLAASNLTSGAATSISLGVANTNGANAAWNYVPASSGTSVAMGPVTATSPFQSLTFFGGGGGQLFLGGANQPGVFSKNNTLDDGTGSMNVVGNFTIPSATVQVTSGLTATNTTSGADNTTINNLVDNNLATEYKPNNNASATSNIVTITSATTLYLTKVTIVYPGGGTAYNTPQSVTVNAGGQQQTATCNSSTTANSVQYVSVTFSPAVVCTSFTLQIFAQSSGAGYPPGWLWDCQVFSLNQASISVPARFSNLVSTANNILDDSTGNMTVGNKLTISGNLIFNSAGTGYLLPTAASSTIALTSQLSNVAFAVISGTGTVTVSGLSQTSGAGFTSTGNQIVIPAGHYYSVTYCLTGAIPANSAGTLTTSLTNSGLFAGSATLSQYNGAIASETFTLDGSYIATGGSQGSTITIATTGFTTNTGASVIIRQLL